MAPRMALSHRPGDRAEASGDIAVLLHQRRQTAISRHAPHHDRVVDHLARLVEDLLDAEVDIAAEPTVELDFLATDRLAALRRARGRRRRTAPASCACARDPRRRRVRRCGSRRSRHPFATGRRAGTRQAEACSQTQGTSCQQQMPPRRSAAVPDVPPFVKWVSVAHHRPFAGPVGTLDPVAAHPRGGR